MRKTTIRLRAYAFALCCFVLVSWIGSSCEPSDQEEKASQFFDSFPSESYSDFAEAEAEAGFRIPRPSEEYPVGFGLTHLQWAPGRSKPTSRTQYVYEPLAPTSIGLSVGPAENWSRRDGRSGEDVLKSGELEEVGGKSGWMESEERGWEFAFPCGSSQMQEIWCLVMAPSTIGWEAFEDFVASIE